MVKVLLFVYQSKKYENFILEMPRTLIKSRLNSNKHKPKNKQEKNNSKSVLPPHLQSFKQKLLSGDGFVDYK